MSVRTVLTAAVLIVLWAFAAFPGWTATKGAMTRRGKMLAQRHLRPSAQGAEVGAASRAARIHATIAADEGDEADVGMAPPVDSPFTASPADYRRATAQAGDTDTCMFRPLRC